MAISVKIAIVQLFDTSWTVAHQAPLSMGFSRQEYWSGLPFPSPGDLPDPGVEPMLPALAGRFLPLSRQGSPVVTAHMELNVYAMYKEINTVYLKFII